MSNRVETIYNLQFILTSYEDSSIKPNLYVKIANDLIMCRDLDNLPEGISTVLKACIAKDTEELIELNSMIKTTSQPPNFTDVSELED